MILRPRGFRDVRTVGDAFTEGGEVLLDLTDISREDARRIMDFCVGLTYAGRGSIERVRDGVFRLSHD
jgi:cell division inhibitor SepF